MKKAEAVKLIKQIQNGEINVLDGYPDELKGSVAKMVWGDNTFRYGAEYGAIAILLKVVGIEKPKSY